MNKYINKRIRINTGLQAIILFALMISLLIPSSTAFADDPTPPVQEAVSTEGTSEGEVEVQNTDPSTEQAPGDELIAESDEVEIAEPAGELQPEGDVSQDVETEAVTEEMPEQIISQLPEGTDLVVVSEEGEVEPLVTQEAEKAIIENDPIWCPDGVTPHALANGCSDSYSSFNDLLNSLVGNDQPTKNGIIWIAKDYDSQTAEPAATKSITIDGNTYKTWRNYSLTLQGGWNGLDTTTVDQSNPSTFSGDTLRIINWQADVTINDLVIDGAAGNAGLMVTTTGDVTVERVESKNNKNNRGAYIDNDAGTGKVTIVDSRFNDNGNGKNDDGLFISSRGSVSLVNVVASGNKDDGVEISNYTSATNASVQIAGTNVFNGNTSDGLYIRSKGAIALENITADGSKKDSGARLDNDEAGAVGGITISGNNSFSGNHDWGLQVYSRGALDFENVVADNNKTQDGAYLDNDTGTGDIIISGLTSFSGNGNGNGDDGLYISSKGNVSLVDLVATGNKDDGVEISNYTSATNASVQIAGTNVFNGNTSDGLYVRSKGAIALENITADGNKKDSGARLDNDEAGAVGGITISGNNSFSGNNDYGLQVYSRGDLDFENVVADNNKTQDGAYLDNDTGTGDIIITGLTSFSGNGNDKNDDGLFISSKGNVSLVDLVATGNKDEGVEIQNTASAASATVQIAGNNLFTSNKGYGLLIRSKGDVLLENLTAQGNGADGANITNHTSTTKAVVSITGANSLSGNTSDGLYVRSKGAIALENITADGNTKDSGARLDNDEAGAVGGITISGNNSFSGNNDYGLQVYSRGALDFENVVADNNKTQDGAYLDNDAGTGDIIITGLTSFSGNGNGNGDDGLYISSKGNVSLVDLVATGNKDEGVEIQNTASATSATVQIAGNNLFTSNKGYGLLIRSKGDVLLENLTAQGNGADGANITNYTSTTKAVVSITGANSLTGNTSDGLYVRSKGAIALENITADGSTKDSGARLDNDEAGAVGGITISGNNSFSGNNDWGLQVYSRGALDFENVVADNNKTQDGAYLDNDAGTGSVKLTGMNSFSSNGNGAGDDGLYITSKGTIVLNEVASVRTTTNSITADNNRGSGVRLDNDSGTGNVLVGGFGNSISNNSYDGLWVSSNGNIDIYHLTASGNKAEGVELITTKTTPNDVNIYCSIFSNNGTYGVFGRYARGSLTFQGDTSFSGNKKGDYYYQTAAGVAGFNPDYECDLPEPPSAAPVPDGINHKSANASTLLIPVTGGQLVPISCEFPFTTLELTESERAVFINLCGYEALIEGLTEAEFPEAIRGSADFQAGMTVVVLQDGLPVEVLPTGSEILLSFSIPQALAQASLAIVYWDPAASNGTGDWVSEQVSVVNGRAELKVNFTGSFFLVSN
jgi:hypothetical protein